ncbi:MAG: class I SAM-dependent methyltransferase [Kiritimatiellae bacterium]|nr:class I SAM-dependent methyltransferase [Kiritimatiellia bacterium]
MPVKQQKAKAKEVEDQLQIFAKSHALKRRLARLEGLLESTAGMTCLVIGGDGALHYHLGRRGGTWHGAARTSQAVDALHPFVDGDVHLVEKIPLPFEDGQFDRILIVDLLEYVQDDHAFIAECHRALHPDGRLLLHVSSVKRGSLMRGVRRLLGVVDPPGRVRRGYTSSELFDVLKDGFDVEVVQGYSRFFAELADTLVRVGAAYLFSKPAAPGAAAEPPDEPDDEKVFRYYAITYPFCWIAAWLDCLLFFTRGHSLVARARRRIWKPRRTPVLHDGRSIAEATLKTRIGTAAPF